MRRLRRHSRRNVCVVKHVLAMAVLCAIAASCGGGNHSAVKVHIRLTHFGMTQSFTLGCMPVGGTLPLAAQVCQDIAQHSQAMLMPRARRSTCLGSPSMPQL